MFNSERESKSKSKKREKERKKVAIKIECVITYCVCAYERKKIRKNLNRIITTYGVLIVAFTSCARSLFHSSFYLCACVFSIYQTIFFRSSSFPLRVPDCCYCYTLHCCCCWQFFSQSFWLSFLFVVVDFHFANIIVRDILSFSI